MYTANRWRQEIINFHHKICQSSHQKSQPVQHLKGETVVVVPTLNRTQYWQQWNLSGIIMQDVSVDSSYKRACAC